MGVTEALSCGQLQEPFHQSSATQPPSWSPNICLLYAPNNVACRSTAQHILSYSTGSYTVDSEVSNPLCGNVVDTVCLAYRGSIEPVIIVCIWAEAASGAGQYWR